MEGISGCFCVFFSEFRPTSVSYLMGGDCGSCFVCRQGMFLIDQKHDSQVGWLYRCASAAGCYHDERGSLLQETHGGDIYRNILHVPQFLYRHRKVDVMEHIGADIHHLSLVPPRSAQDNLTKLHMHVHHQ